ncbi:NAD(P)/FAD-dependent oxidoreductase [Tateyamaria sp. SN3-11]|uniref:NAD(P)/FAD-dependent oxidoreductase n=1 Tax=Tateyamaria sp. SN3-11 TaxID=3092147 RepID=UPI0039EB9D1C
MRRIFSDYAYGPGPRTGCWWDNTVDIASNPTLQGDVACDVAIVGGGFTGLSAALHLARAGASVVLLDANSMGWGASGRNGGFCCLGGGMASDGAIDQTYGRAARLEWRRTEVEAVRSVEALIAELDLDVERHSVGETCLAHRAREMLEFEADAARVQENYGVMPELVSRDELHTQGMSGPFHGAMTIPIGFGLNPAKLVKGLLDAARAAGARCFDNSAVTQIDGTHVVTKRGTVRADRIILATNGYSSEDVPDWMATRYMPAQSTVLVTRPITAAEQQAQGWTTGQMAYDTRKLLHYFRLMPDGRFLFGMRGGVFSSARAEARARHRVLQDFRRMFPAWRGVEVTHSWSGMVCLARNMLPFAGVVPGAPHLLAGFAYHGNGVAMGNYAGRILAELALGHTPDLYPAGMQDPARRFPFGPFRRMIMPPLYGAFHLSDLKP